MNSGTSKSGSLGTSPQLPLPRPDPLVWCLVARTNFPLFLCEAINVILRRTRSKFEKLWPELLLKNIITNFESVHERVYHRWVQWCNIEHERDILVNTKDNFQEIALNCHYPHCFWSSLASLTSYQVHRITHLVKYTLKRSRLVLAANQLQLLQNNLVWEPRMMSYGHDAHMANVKSSY